MYLAKPETFNDPYDCVIGYDKSLAAHGLVIRFAHEFGLELEDESGIADNEERLATHLNGLTPEAMPNLKTLCDGADNIWSHLMYYSMLLNVKQRNVSSYDVECIESAVREKLGDINRITDMFGVSCFSSTVENAYMWGHYANGFRGFAIEYDLSPIQDGYELGNHLLKLASNIWDVFYVMNRPLLTKETIEYLTNDINGEWLRLLYVKALCTKSLSWAFEGESRLILPLEDEDVVRFNRNIPFLPAKRIYLGQSMKESDKKSIQDICKGLPQDPQVLEMVPKTDSFAPEFRELP